MPSISTLAAPAVAIGALLAPGCEPSCAPSGNRAVVWEAADPSRVNRTDPQPAFGSSAPTGTAVRIDQLLWIDPNAPGGVSDVCQAEIAAYASIWGTVETHCLFVEWEVDVGAAETRNTRIVDGPMTSSDGRQIQGCCEDAQLAPGSSSTYGVFYPGIGPGSTLRWDVETDDGAVTHQYLVPAADQFQPFTWEL